MYTSTLVYHLPSTLQLTADTPKTRIAAAVVIRGAGCAVINASLPEPGDSHLQEKERKYHRTTREKLVAGLPRSMLPPT